MRWEQPIQYATISDIGFRRRNNQDACVVRVTQDEDEWNRRGHLFVVADGMGGHAVGELASKIAVDTIPHTYFKSRSADDIPTALKAAIEDANAAIFARGNQNHDFKRMGTTCVALVLSPIGAVSGHVGDSRLYRIRDGHVDQLTFDHSLQWELLREGRLKPEEIFLHESRHVITRSLGPENEVQVDIEGPFPVLPDDTYVLCSDGLTTHVSDAEIGVIAQELPVGAASRLLTHLANLRGGSDNITVVIANAGDLPSEASRYYHNEETKQRTDSVEPNWWWLGAWWAMAVAFAIGVSLVLFEHDLPGLALIVSAVVGLTLISGRWFGKRKEYLRQNDFPESVHFTPYRAARFQLDLNFLNHLSAIEAELQRTANEEDWTIDKKAHETAFRSAKQAMHDRRFNEALSNIAKAIDVLMAGVQFQRKLADRQAKWGKNGHANGPS
jgi:PPM family protein phosphatase